MNSYIFVSKLVVLAVCLHTLPPVYASIEDQTTLQNDLLRNYSRNVRPYSSVTVPIALTVKNLIALDIVNEYMVISGSLLVQWQDHRLHWNTADYNNVTSMYFKVDEIWRPLLVLSNAADAIYAIGDNSDQRSIPILSLSHGGLLWVAPAFFKSICSIDVSMFPFDTQRCELSISSWMFDRTIMQFVNIIDSVATTNYEENGEYHLSRTYTEIRDIIAFGATPWSYAVFGFEFQRRYSYYIINMVMPVLFLEVLGVLVFALPASSGEKLTYALTLLLSLVVMVGIVAEKIPSTSLQVPLLSIYILEGVALSVMEVLIVVYILKLRSWHEAGKTIGPGHTFLAAVLMKRSCCRRNKINGLKDDVIDININTKEKNQASACEPHDDTVSFTTDTDSEKCNYEELAGTLERLCFWIFTFLLIASILQAIITIYIH